jgi:hypothetical protein
MEFRWNHGTTEEDQISVSIRVKRTKYYLNILHDEVFLGGKIKDLLQLDNIRMRDGGENGNLTLNHVLLSLGHPETL